MDWYKRISEVRWNTSGMTTLSSGHTIVYSGKPSRDEFHDKGSGIYDEQGMPRQTTVMRMKRNEFYNSLHATVNNVPKLDI